MEDKNIIIKIKKLLALSESNNENESKQAILKAQELLLKHKLTLRQVLDEDEEKVVVEKTEVKFTKAKWKIRLANLIGENFSCYVYAMTNKTNTVVFLGLEKDTKISTIVLNYAIEIIDKEVGKLRYKYRKDGYSTKGLEADYASGFIQGLAESLERQKEENQEWALVLKKDKRVVETFENIKFHKCITLNSENRSFTNVHKKGIRDGLNFTINDKLISTV